MDAIDPVEEIPFYSLPLKVFLIMHDVCMNVKYIYCIYWNYHMVFYSSFNIMKYIDSWMLNQTWFLEMELNFYKLLDSEYMLLDSTFLSPPPSFIKI